MTFINRPCIYVNMAQIVHYCCQLIAFIIWPQDYLVAQNIMVTFLQCYFLKIVLFISL